MSGPAIDTQVEAIRVQCALIRRQDKRLGAVEQAVAEMRGQLAQIGQRIGYINARLPVAVGYLPPEDRKRA